MTVNIVTDGMQLLTDLLAKKVSTNQNNLEEHITRFFNYSVAKSQGRAVSSKLHHTEAVASMIDECVCAYRDGASASELCQTRLLRKLSKHDASNDSYVPYLRESVIPALVKKIFNGDDISKHPKVASYLLEYTRTLFDPLLLAKIQLPQEVQERIRGERHVIEGLLHTWYFETERLNASDLKTIIEAICQDQETQPLPALNEDNKVIYFIRRISNLINSEPLYKTQIRSSMLEYLKSGLI